MNVAEKKYRDTSIREIVWAPTDEMLAVACGGTVAVLDTRTGEMPFVQTYEAPVTGLTFSRDHLFAVGAGNRITVGSSDTWNETVRLETDSPVTALQFCCSQPSLLVCGSANGTVTVFDLKNSRTTQQHLHNSPVKSVAWGLRHTSVVSAEGREIVESVFDAGRCELTQSNRRKARSDFLATVNRESLIRGADPADTYKDHRLDYGASWVSANQGTLEYHLPQTGRLGTRRIEDSIRSLRWVGDFPFNFVTGHRRGAITLWGIEIAHRSYLTRWVSQSTVSEAILEPLLKIDAGHAGAVTALAAPSVQNQHLASGCAEGTVKIWDVNHEDLRERAAHNAKHFIVTGSFAMIQNGTAPPKADISVSPKSVLRRTFDVGSIC